MPKKTPARTRPDSFAELNLKLRDAYIAETRECLLACADALEELRRATTILGAPVSAIAVSVHREHYENANLRAILNTKGLFFGYALEPCEAYLDFYYGGEFGRIVGTVRPGDSKNIKPYEPFSRHTLKAQRAVYEALSKASYIGNFVYVEGAIVAEIPCANFERVILLPIRIATPCYTDPHRPILPHVAEWLRRQAAELAEGATIVVGGPDRMFEAWSSHERLDYETRRADLPEELKAAFDRSVSMSDPVEPIHGDRFDLMRGDGLAVLAVNDRGHHNALPAAVLDLETPIPAPAEAPPLTTRVLYRPQIAPMHEEKFLDLANGLAPQAAALLTGFGAAPGDYDVLRIDGKFGEGGLNLWRVGAAGEQWLGPDRPPPILGTECPSHAWKHPLVKTAGAVLESSGARRVIDMATLNANVTWTELSREVYRLRERYVFVARAAFDEILTDELLKEDLPFKIGLLAPSGRALADGEAACIAADPDFVAGLTAPEREVYERVRAPLDVEIIRELDATVQDEGVRIWLWRRGRAAALLVRCEDTFEDREFLGLLDLGA